MPGSTHILDYVTFLQELGETNEPYFLEGGQAVNFWAEFYSARSRADGLNEFLPFTSKDCDIWIGWAALKYFQAGKGGTFTKGDSPADGQIGVFTIDEMPPRTIDVMSGVYGIRAAENDMLLERAPRVNGISVLDPLNLFRSKCHCLIDLDQTDRQDGKHLRMLCLILPVYLSELVAEAESGAIAERHLLREVKLLRRYCSLSRCRRALLQIKTSPEALFPIRAMKESGLARLAAFARATWPDED